MTAITAESHPVAHSQAPAAPRALGAQPSKAALWTGRILSGFAVLFLAVDASFKFLQSPEAIEGTTRLGYPASVLPVLGLLQLVCLAVYLFPRTAILGA